MKLIIYVLFLFLYAFSSSGQSFQKTFGSVNSDEGSQLIKTSDNNYSILGQEGEFFGCSLLKIDSLGNPIWEKSYSPGDLTRGIYNCKFQETRDGGFIISATTFSGMGNATYMCLIRTNALGDTLWTKHFSGPNPGYFEAEASEVIQTSDNGFAIVGTEIGSFDENIFLVKTDSMGNIQWGKYYGGTEDEKGLSLKQTDDSGYILTGYTASFGQGYNDVYLIKTNLLGSLEWTKTYGGNRNDFANHIEITNDGGYILTGVTSGFGIGSTIDYDLFLMKTDSAGNNLWSNIYGNDKQEEGSSVKQTPDGGFIVTGYSDDSSSVGDRDVLLLKTDSTGNILFAENFGGSSMDLGVDVIQSDANYLVVGKTRNFSRGMTDMYLIKTDSVGRGTCKQNSSLINKAVLSWIQSTGGIENSGYTIQSKTITVNLPDTISSNPCNCIPPIAAYQVYETDGCGYFENFSTWADTWFWDFGNGDTANTENAGTCFNNGTYFICMTVENQCGTNTYCDSSSFSGGVFEILNNALHIKISPNPLSEKSYIQFDNFKNEKIKLQILNTVGQTVYSSNYETTNVFEIDGGDFSPGFYFVQLSNEKSIIGFDKIIIQ